MLVCDRRTGDVLGTLYPIDKTLNADAVRRPRPAPGVTAVPAATGVAPLLQALLDEYRASGLPPAYQPKDEPGPEEDDR